MKSRQNPFRLLCLLVGLVWVAYSTSPTQALPASKIKELKNQAELLEKQGQWGKACTLYATILEHRRNSAEIRDRYLFCLHRYFQVRRHSDPSYFKEVLTLEYAQSLRLYQFMTSYLASNTLESHRATPERLFRKGLEELHHALASPVFISTHLNKVPPAKIREFRAALQSTWGNRSVYSAQQATDLVREVAIAALKKLKLRPTTTVMEFTCGGCYAIDDYTMYLTPSELRSLCNTIKGESVGVGLKLVTKGDKLVIIEIAPESPAADVMPVLAKYDQVVSIDRKPVSKIPAEVAADLLQGEPGTEVELVIQSPTVGTRVLNLRRRAVYVGSVDYQLKQGQIGYIAITNFQESTIHELDAALMTLSKMEMKGLVLDLRGNSGGLFPSAIEVARRFLANGVIVSTQTPDPKHSTTYHARNTSALTLPLVVLVDGKTASAAEILAGTLKENNRGRLVGQNTFGKGCIQEIYQLSPQSGLVFPGGLRVTVARFLSPTGAAYTGRGIDPHILVEQPPTPDADPQLARALNEAERLVEELE